MALRLLLVDGDASHRGTLGKELRGDGFAVSTAADLGEAVEQTERDWPHLVLTDLGFPDGTAAELAGRLRRRGELPIVVVAANRDAQARARAIEQFADDFVSRPYLYAELLARVRRVLRRALPRAGTGDGRIDLGAGRWVDLRLREASDGARMTYLTPTEARLLDLFLGNPGQTLPNELILQRTWLDPPSGPSSLWEYVRRLRHKLGDDGRPPRLIVSRRGLGYRWGLRDVTRGPG